MVRIRVRQVLSGVPGIDLIGEASGGHAGVKMALDLNPDVVLMDVSMPDLNGVEATRQICASAPSIRVLAFSEEMAPPVIEAMAAAGARGYLLKNTAPAEWVRAIRSVMDGDSYQSPGLSCAPWPPNEAQGEPQDNIPGDSKEQVGASRASNPGSWLVEYLPDKKLVASTLTGAITDADAKNQAEKAIRLLKDNQSSQLLVDCREAVSEMSFAVLYWMPRFYAQLGAPRSTRIAVVLPTVPNRLESYQFYALACRNAGYNVRLFETRRVAEDWLSHKS
jgi:CheY-like chemotaxis protein